MMGGMGRAFDGGYAEQVVALAGQVIPFRSDLPWEQLGALPEMPEMLQTAHGSLAVGVHPERGDALLIRGWHVLDRARANRRGQTAASHRVRDHQARAGLGPAGAARRGPCADRRRNGRRPGPRDHPRRSGRCGRAGRSAQLQDTLDAVRPGGTVCLTGMLSNYWTIPEFYPMDWLPNGVRLTAYSGEAADLDTRDPAGLPRRRRRWRGHHPARPRVPVGPDRPSPARHGNRHRRRKGVVLT